MTNPPVARLAFLSFPGPGVVCINLQVDGKDTKAELTRDQIRNIVVEGAAFALRVEETV